MAVKFERLRSDYVPSRFFQKAFNECNGALEVPLSSKDFATLTNYSGESFRRIIADGDNTDERLIDTAATIMKLTMTQIRHLKNMNILDRLENTYGWLLSEKETAKLSALIAECLSTNLPANALHSSQHRVR